MEEGLSEKEREHGSKGGRETSREVVYHKPTIHKPALALDIGCICHGMDSMHYREPERSRVTI